MEQLAIKCQNICIKLSNFELNNFNFDLKKGYVIALIGSNGAVKTTIIKTIADAIDRKSGTILYDGMKLWEHEKEIKRKLGVVFDNANFSLMVKPTRLAKDIASVEKSFDMEYFYKQMDRFKIYNMYIINQIPIYAKDGYLNLGGNIVDLFDTLNGSTGYLIATVIFLIVSIIISYNASCYFVKPIKY